MTLMNCGGVRELCGLCVIMWNVNFLLEHKCTVTSEPHLCFMYEYLLENKTFKYIA